MDQTKFHLPSPESIVRQYPPDFFTGKSNEFVIAKYLETVCALQVKHIQEIADALDSELKRAENLAQTNTEYTTSLKSRGLVSRLKAWWRNEP